MIIEKSLKFSQEKVLNASSRPPHSFGRFLNSIFLSNVIRSYWKNSPQGKILKSDVTIAKSYLNQEEISKLDRLSVL
jgi:hypothetical protein